MLTMSRFASSRLDILKLRSSAVSAATAMRRRGVWRWPRRDGGGVRRVGEVWVRSLRLNTPRI